AIQGARTAGRPALRSIRTVPSVYGPEVSYTRNGGSLAVGCRSISRNGTAISGRSAGLEYTLRDPATGPVVTAAGLVWMFMGLSSRVRLPGRGGNMAVLS